MKSRYLCAAALIALAGCNSEPEPQLVLLSLDSAAAWRDAIEGYSRQIENAGVAPDELAVAHLQRGTAYAHLQRNAEALRDLTRSIELNGRNGLVFSLRGYLYGLAGEFDLAEKDHAIAVGSAPPAANAQRAIVLQNAADLWRRRREFARALEVCDEALASHASPLINLRRAWIYSDMGRTGEARTEFAKFDAALHWSQLSSGLFWPDELEAITRLRSLQ